MMDLTGLTAPIFNIQTYCIHDGPGIRVTVFIKGCPLRCLWCANPESNLPEPQLMFYSSKCVSCGKCAAACPNKAVRLEEKEGRILPATDRTLCTNCGECAANCPGKAREIAGKDKTVGEVLGEVLKDKLFMDASGGGITLSGGEPLMRPEFSAALLKASREAGIGTAVETSMFASPETVDRVFEYADIALMDIKHMDSRTHRELTGVPNEQILENIRHVVNDKKIPAIIRIPVIPGCNDSFENMQATARFIAEDLQGRPSVHLLPYHKMGISKAESIDRNDVPEYNVPTQEHMEELKAIFDGMGIKTQIGG